MLRLLVNPVSFLKAVFSGAISFQCFSIFFVEWISYNLYAILLMLLLQTETSFLLTVN